MPLSGTWHCGAITVTIAFEPDEATECNCSICRRTGGLWAYGAPDDITVTGTGVGYVQGDKSLTTWHCGTCGITTHWTPMDPDYNRMGVNLRLFDPAVWENLPRTFVDGASW